MADEPPIKKAGVEEKDTELPPDDSTPELNDVVLIVKGQKFSCSKTALSENAEFFKEKFFSLKSEDTDKLEVTLEDPKAPEEFDAFLKVINKERCLSDENVEGVLRLSILWQAPIIEERCLEFLTIYSKMDDRLKFDLAIKVNSEALKKRILSGINWMHDLHRMIPSDRSTWDHATTNLVFEKTLELSGWMPPDSCVNIVYPLAPMPMFSRRSHTMSSEPTPKKIKMDESTAQMSFDNSEDPHDIVFVVHGKKFYCSKVDLAKQSDYFKSMLFGNFTEKDKAEIHLNDPDTPEQFEAFLKVINAIKCLTDDNVEGVLRLCDQWQAPIVKERCIEFLTNGSKKSPKDRFNLALQFRLEVLKIRVLSELNTIEKLHRIIPADRSYWDQPTTKMVFEKHLLLTGYKPTMDTAAQWGSKALDHSREENRAQLLEPPRQRFLYADLLRHARQRDRAMEQQ
ncbi:hypothetical protein CAEBREN_10765 [Caenorhabditis brenneri]|uniref:BTB domain-containing protein n=1 Tax=Caenorhabditis brenneri TaxID=135651 RepID=G0MV26_CAEBE|nr:hypothetical protein CAEBREN_10765 [Caenorhabditis brenneri]